MKNKKNPVRDITNAYLERTLELPKGTVKRWRKGKMYREERALIWVLKEFPWVIAVADEKFDPVVAAQYERRYVIGRLNSLEKKVKELEGR